MVHTVEFANGARNDGGYVFAFSCGQGYAEANMKVRIWRLDEGCKEASISEKDDRIMVKGHLSTFAPTAFSHDSKTLLYLTSLRDEWGNHWTVVVIDVETGTENFQMQGHKDSIMWTGLSPDDQYIASAARDGYLKLYSTIDGILIRNYGPTGGQNCACAFDKEGKNLMVTTTGWQRVISYSPDGTKLAIGAADGRLVVYETNAMSLIQVWQPAKEQNGYRWDKDVTGIKWLEEGRRICWKTMNGRKDDTWRPGAWFNTLVVLESSGLIGSKDQDGALRIWELPEKTDK
ncbi:WD40 repeat-like protein [Acephala macrosclerotiorum]|nr:WD40 repeat-like protein [Acephala macrosclerotiorum]